MAVSEKTCRRAAAICEHLEFLGIRLLPSNERNAAIISRAASPVTIRVMTTSEELMIARHTGYLMRHQKGIIHEIH